MRRSRWQGRCFLAIATCAAAALGTAHADQPTLDSGPQQEAQVGNAQNAAQALRVASRDMVERYYRAYQLIGSYVLNLDGQRIGQVENLVLDEHGEVQQVLVTLSDNSDSDGGPIAISPHRAEIVSTAGSRVTVIRIDLTREELVQAQLVHLKSDARAPAEREAGQPDAHDEIRSLY
jgi:sporulation protein YlmC with PRC-barrel domain